MTRVMVTGGKGFVGSELVKYLKTDSNEVYTYDLKDNQDILDSCKLREFVKTFDPEEVYHLAAQINPRSSEIDRKRDWDINVQGTLNVIDAMMHHGVKKLVFSSSDAVIYPKSNYGVSKLAAEEYVKKYSSSGDIYGRVVRFSSIYGIGRSGGAINAFINKAIAGEKLSIYNGNSRRDYVHVSDCARALELVMNKGMELRYSYNIGNGILYTTDEIAEYISMLSGAEIEFTPDDTVVTFGSEFNTNLLRSLGYRPHYNILHGIKNTYLRSL